MRRRQAAELLERALVADPDSIAAAAKLGAVLIDDHQEDRLVTAFRSALVRAKSPDAVVLLGAEVARVARDALSRGGGAPTVLNAANETAVGAFLEGRIGFLEIAETVERTLDAVPAGALDTLADVYRFDEMARQTAGRLARARAPRREAREPV